MVDNLKASVSGLDSGRSFRRAAPVFLAFCWSCGILFGVLVAARLDASTLSLMCRAVSCPVSIVGSFGVLLLPFLFSALAVFISRPTLLLAISFLKGFSFSFISFSMLLALSSDGWLLRLLTMFSDLAGLPVLFWYWLRHIQPECNHSFSHSFFVFSLLVLIGSVDICCVSPFLAMLINS